MEEIEKIVNKISELNGYGKRILMLKIFERDVINFPDVSEAYVKALEAGNKKKETSINTLGLMLASYCINDKSNGGKNSRKHLYESGAFTENDGTPFGRQLSEEFNQ